VTCKTYFTAVGGDAFEKIGLAAIYLRANPLSIWVVKSEKPKTWNAWAESLVADPAKSHSGHEAETKE
jgi:hypothetical protein